PQSSEEWHTALEAIKLLYHQRQYKQCAARVTELLTTAPEPINAVHKTFLYFYSAISYEAMGLSAHSHSRNKLQLLHFALDSFVTCSTALPSPIPSTERYSNISEALFTTVPSESSFSSSDYSPGSRTRPSSLASSLADMIERSLACGSADEDSFVSHDSDGDIGVTYGEPCAGILAASASHSHLIPSPLKVRKPSGASTSSFADNTPLPRPPPPLPLRVVPRDIRPSSPGLHREIPFADALSTLDEDRSMTPFRSVPTNHISNYNSSIRSLQSQIISSIASIQAVIDEVTEMQHTRRVSKSIRRSASFWSFSPVKDKDRDSSSSGSSCLKFTENSSGRTTVTESMEQRIERLRSEGWQTVGLRSRRRGWKGEEYYRAYCGRVLDELY
ncbi:uncharacterized protein BO97DRAFT_314137, partial [Aspergillus homomorphus CBS 101889]